MKTTFHFDNRPTLGVHEFFNEMRESFSIRIFRKKNNSQHMKHNQHDALFILSLLSCHTSTSFGRISSPSSEGRCIYVATGTCYTVQLTVSRPGWNGTHSIPATPIESQLRRITNTICHIYTL
jgi:hypothetical protein